MINEIEASQLSDIEFKTMVIRKLNKLTENYQNYRETMKNSLKTISMWKGNRNYQQELRRNEEHNFWIENTVEGIKSRLDEGEDRIRELKER